MDTAGSTNTAYLALAALIGTTGAFGFHQLGDRSSALVTDRVRAGLADAASPAHARLGSSSAAAITVDTEDHVFTEDSRAPDASRSRFSSTAVNYATAPSASGDLAWAPPELLAVIRSVAAQLNLSESPFNSSASSLPTYELPATMRPTARRELRTAAALRESGLDSDVIDRATRMFERDGWPRTLRVSSTDTFEAIANPYADWSDAPHHDRDDAWLAHARAELEPRMDDAHGALVDATRAALEALRNDTPMAPSSVELFASLLSAVETQDDIARLADAERALLDGLARNNPALAEALAEAEAVGKELTPVREEQQLRDAIAERYREARAQLQNAEELSAEELAELAYVAQARHDLTKVNEDLPGRDQDLANLESSNLKDMRADLRSELREITDSGDDLLGQEQAERIEEVLSLDRKLHHELVARGDDRVQRALAINDSTRNRLLTEGQSAQQLLVDAAEKLAASRTDYVWGAIGEMRGDTQTFDCTGFLGYIMNNELGIDIPRQTEDLSEIGDYDGQGYEVSVDEMQPGDFVFIRSPGHPRNQQTGHAGVYAGDGKIIHASSSQGGVVEDEWSESSITKVMRWWDTPEAPIGLEQIKIEENGVASAEQVMQYAAAS